MRTRFKIYSQALLFALFCFAGNVYAKLNILACEPEWAALAIEISGNHANVVSATTAMQDPHHIQARPSLIAKSRNADLLICSGAGLEAGWLPVLIRKSANPKIRPGKLGHLLTTNHVDLLGKPASDDGSIHSKGNPHVHFDPNRILIIAQVIYERLSKIDPSNSTDYLKSLDQFSQDWRGGIHRLQQQAKAIQGMPVIVHHDSWIYLFNWLGIKQVATLEPKHGVPPSSGYLASLLEKIKSDAAKVIIRSGYEDERASQWLSDKSGIPVITIPFSVSNYQEKGSLQSWMNQVIRILAQSKSQ